jgi:hypothetical protein
MTEVRWSKYVFVFLITAALFGTAFLASELFYGKRVREIESLERRISLSLLSSDVQFNLLLEAPCASESSAVLADEINALAKRLEYLENERGSEDSEVVFLKSRYSLLQIKDLLLVKEIAKRCGASAHTIVYFYSNRQGECGLCERQGYVLSALRDESPELKVYAFDYNLELGGIDALKKIYGVRNELPVLVVERKPYYGYRDLDAVYKLLPGLATTTALK